MHIKNKRRPIVIEFSEVRKSFGDHMVLDGISFTAPDGKVTGLVGPMVRANPLHSRYCWGCFPRIRARAWSTGCPTPSVRVLATRWA